MDHDDDEVELDRGIIAVGGTRPAMIPGLGMPLWDFGIFVIAAGEGMIFMPVLLLPIGLLFVWMLKLYARDYNAGRVLLCFLSTNARHLSTALGGTFLSPGRYRGYYRGVPE